YVVLSRHTLRGGTAAAKVSCWRWPGTNMPIFFSGAEDGIRDFHVTGVQTCALPIFGLRTKEGLFPLYVVRRPMPSSRAATSVKEIGRASCRDRGWSAAVAASST